MSIENFLILQDKYLLAKDIEIQVGTHQVQTTYLPLCGNRRASVEEDNLYTYIISVTKEKEKKTQINIVKLKSKSILFTYNSEIEVASVEARHL